VQQLEDDSVAIERAKKLFEHSMLPVQLAIIKANFTGLAVAISALKGRLPLKKSISIVDKVQVELTLEPFAAKLSSILKKNPDFAKLRNLAHIINGDSTAELGAANINEPFLFTHAPITSVDCERTLTKLQALLTDNRTSLKEKHIRDILLVQWNDNLTK